MYPKLTPTQKEALHKLKEFRDKGGTIFIFGNDEYGDAKLLNGSRDIVIKANDFATLLDLELLRRERGHVVFTWTALAVIDNNYEFPQATPSQQNIGIQFLNSSISGGNIQGVGLAADEVSQIINDPVLLQEKLDFLIEKLVEAVKFDLPHKQLLEYLQTTEELKRQLLAESPPDRSLIQKLIGTASFLDSANGTWDLTLKVWPLIFPLVQIAAHLISSSR